MNLPATLKGTAGPSLIDSVGRSAGGGADVGRLLDALGVLARDRRAVTAWLRTFDDPLRAAEVAARSYWHPNGFAKLVLHLGPDFRIRLHVWPEGPDRRGESNPHGHRWDFASTVLCGDGLSTIEYAESPAGERYDRYRFTGGPKVGALTQVGNARLRSSEPRIITTHDRYSVDTSVIHTVEPLGTSLVATLVVQGAARMSSTLVYCAAGQDADQPGLPISAGEVRELVVGIAEASDRVARESR